MVVSLPEYACAAVLPDANLSLIISLAGRYYYVRISSGTASDARPGIHLLTQPH